jgi:hypothetical protein
METLLQSKQATCSVKDLLSHMSASHFNLSRPLLSGSFDGSNNVTVLFIGITDC